MTGYYHIRNLKKDYNPQDKAQLAAIDIACLDIELGGIIAIVGGSGSGKTTFLNLISGLEDFDCNADSRTVLDLKLPGAASEIQLSASKRIRGEPQSFPHERVSYIFQQGYLLSQASIGINLAMTRRAAGLRADAQSLDELLSMAQLHDASDDNLARKSLKDRALTLSGGQQQRINIARALGREPEILFADELSSSLDPHKARLVLTELRNWLWQGNSDSDDDRRSLHRTMLWVTHDYELACDYADAIVVMHEGHVAQHCERPIELGRHQPSVAASDVLAWVDKGQVPLRKSQEEAPQLEVISSQSSSDANAVRYTQRDTHQISSTQAIIGNIGSGIALSWLEAFPQPRPSRSKIITVLRQVCRPLTGFSHWVRALQLAAVLALIMIITYGRNEVIAYFDAQLNDPTLRHVIVQQNTKELQRSVIDDESLNMLSEAIAGLSAAQPENPKSAFGRFTEFVDVYPEGVDQTNPGFIAETTIGVLDRDEPAYHGLKVAPLDASTPGCTSAVTLPPGDLIPYDDELTLIVSLSYIEQVKKMFNKDLCNEPFLDLWDAGAPRTFRVVGYVPAPPADGYDHFDAMMQIGVWRNWVSLVGKSKIESFSRAAVYFTQSNHKGVIAELYNRAFAFDREIVNKFERLIGTAAKLRNTFLVISWLTLAVAATVAAGLIWSYLAQNSKSIAVLRAHAAWIWPLAAAIPFQLLLTFVYSLVYIAITIALWNRIAGFEQITEALSRFTGGSWVPSRLSWPMIETTLPWVAGSLAVMLVVGWVCLFVWRITHHRIAHELRQAY